MHTHDYRTGKEWKGKDVLVLGTGTSGHDIAQDLHGHDANVKMIQRGGTAVASLKAVSSKSWRVKLVWLTDMAVPNVRKTASLNRSS